MRPEVPVSEPAFLSGGGEMGALFRAHDWSASPLGPPEGWPQPLRTLVGMLLAAQQPMFLVWGPGRALLYNDRYTGILARKHPALGCDFLDVWREVEAELAPLVERAYGGEPLHADDIELMVERSGYLEEAHFSFSCTPVRDEADRVAGFLCVLAETTRQVFAEQRQAFRLVLEERLRRAATPREALDAACEVLGRALGGVICTFNEWDADATWLDVIGEWRAGGMPSAFGRHRIEDWGPDRLPGLRSGQPERIDDVLTDPRTAGSAAEAAYAALGCRASLNVPFMREGRVRATLAVGAAAPRRWRDEEMALAAETVERTWHAVERARAETALREGEARYRTLFETIDEGFCVVEFIDGPHGPLSDYVHLEANPAYLRHAGIPDIVGKTGRQGLTESEADAWVAIFRGVLDTGQPVRFERELASTDRCLEVACFRVEPAARRQVAIVFQDVSVRKRAQRRLRELNETLESQVAERTAERDRMWNSSPDLMLVIDFEGYFRRVNPAWTTLLGYAPGELVGHHVNEFVLPDDHVPTVDAYETAAAGGRPAIENRYRHKDGSIRWIAWVAAPAGDMTYATGRDITLEKARQAELAQAQEALRQSQKMEAVGQLTGGLAHDFNNLLASISGGLQVLKLKLQRGQYDGLERYIDIGESSVRRAASLTQRLLAFSRRQTLAPKPTDVNRLIAGMEELVRRSVGPMVELEVVHAPDLWPTRVDPSQLENALLNLCINARDAMMPGGGKLRLVTANESVEARAAKKAGMPPGQYVSLCVSDTGTGMTPEVVARIFDPFFTTKPLGEGTGLGLSMVYGFVRQSDGQVRVHSEPGVGTTMCLYLPRHAGAAQAEPAAEAPSIESGQGETVLVIEDERTLRDIVEEVLRDAGYRVLTAQDGPAGLQVLDSDARVDLLITDVGLPGGLNGRQVADAARVRRPDLRVLFITGYADTAAVGDGRLDPGMDMITKPFEIGALANKVRALIDARLPA